MVGVGLANAPVVRCKDIGELTRVVVGDRIKLKGQTASKAQSALAPVAAVAFWLAKYQPRLVSQDRLGLIVGGAERAECIDDGAWWSLLGPMLGRPEMKISMALVGPQASCEWKTGLVLKSNLKGQLHRMTLEKFCKENSLSSFDGVALLHPGLMAHVSDWLEDGGLAEVMQERLPVGVCSFTEEESLMEAAVAEVAGICSQPGQENAFRLRSKSDAVGFGWVWEFTGREVVTDVAAAEDRMREILGAAKVLGELASRDQVRGVALPEEVDIGREKEITSSLSNEDVYVKVVRDIYVRKSTGRVYKLEAGDVATEIGVSLSDISMSRYPGTKARWVDRLVWSMGVWDEQIRPVVDNRLFRSFGYGTGQTDVPGRSMHSGSAGKKGGMTREEAIRKLKGAGAEDMDAGDLLSAMEAFMAQDPDRVMTEDEKRLFWLVEQGNEVGAIDLLGKKRWDDMPRNAEHRSLFHACIDAKMYELMARGIEAGFDVDGVDAEGWPPVVHAASQNDANAIRLLVGKGRADGEAMTRMGWKAMSTALTRGAWEAAGALLDEGVSANSSDAMGRSALQLSTQLPMPDWLKAKISGAS
jgi:hypothetical protein